MKQLALLTMFAIGALCALDDDAIGLLPGFLGNEQTHNDASPIPTGVVGTLLIDTAIRGATEPTVSEQGHDGGTVPGLGTRRMSSLGNTIFSINADAILSASARGTDAQQDSPYRFAPRTLVFTGPAAAVGGMKQLG